MPSAAQLTGILEQVGPALAGAEHVTQIAEGLWAVGFDARTTVMLELDTDGTSLALTVDLGRCAEDRRAAAYQSLLTYNALWRETGGVCMAVADGEVLQIARIDPSGLDAESLAGVLQRFVDKAAVWRSYLESGEDVESAGQPVGLRV